MLRKLLRRFVSKNNGQIASFRTVQTKAAAPKVRIEQLTTNHDLLQIRYLLQAAFFAQDTEPLVQNLLKYHYNNAELTYSDRMKIAEEKGAFLYSEKVLRHKIKQDLSYVIVAKDDPSLYLAVLFVEHYQGVIKVGKLQDEFCKDVYMILNHVHREALPLLRVLSGRKIAYLSHACTRCEYQCNGIYQHFMNHVLLPDLERNGFDGALMINPSERVVNSVTKVLGFRSIARIKYHHLLNEHGQVMFPHQPGSVQMTLKLF